jgi:hypothetical protein
MENWIKYLEILASVLLSGGIYTIYKGIIKPQIFPAISVNDPERFRKINRHFMTDKKSLLKTGWVMTTVGLIIFVITIALS